MRAIEDLKKVNNINIVQIGCGGTGSYFFPPMVKFMRSYTKINQDKLIKYTLVDYDTVEIKNIYRQNFTIKDIYLNKAIALMRAYYDESAKADGLEVRASDTKINSQFSFLKFIQQSDAILNLVIGCSDSISARLLINSELTNLIVSSDGLKLIYVDCGSAIHTGQVFVIGYNKADNSEADNFAEVMGSPEVKAINEQTVGCSDNGDQSIFSNFRNADLLYTVVSEIIVNQQTSVSKLEFTHYTLTSTLSYPYQMKVGLV
jgi:molybdopterin/thiamine biosynthesis adenylyltransferase